MPEEQTVQDLTLEQLAKKTRMSPAELFELRVPESCDKGHEALRYTPEGGKAIHVDCGACGYNDIAHTDAHLRLYEA